MAPLRKTALSFIFHFATIALAGLLATPAISAGRAGRAYEHIDIFRQHRSDFDYGEVARHRREEIDRQRLLDDTFQKASDPKLFNREQSRYSDKSSEYNSKDDYTVLDGLEDDRERQALKDRLETDEMARHIGLDSWKFTKPPTVELIDDILALARQKLPGKVELGLFLSEKTYGESYNAIVNAWGERPLSEPPTSDLVHDYMRLHQGNTLIVVGHVEGNAYVFEYNDKKVSVDIRLLLNEAVQNNVLLIPIGCKTAFAGAPLGFLDTISTADVASFLKTFPKGNALQADMLAGFASIGHIRLDNGRADGSFEIRVERLHIVSDPELKYPDSTLPPVITTRIPYRSPPSGGAYTSQSSSISFAAQSPRAFGALKTLFYALVSIAAWFILVAITWLTSVVLRRWTLERRQRQWIYRALRFPGTMTAGALICATLFVPLAVMIAAVPLCAIFGYFEGGFNGALFFGICGCFLAKMGYDWRQEDWF